MAVDWGNPKDVQLLDEEWVSAYTNAVQYNTRLIQRLSTENSYQYVGPATPWLLIRYSSGDLGYRPIPANQVFWESPDIWVETEDPLGNPVAGNPNFVHARVFNLGQFHAAPLKVDFYWGDPSVGLDAAHMHLIGTEYIKLASLWSADVRCSTPWIPTFENGGHECLIVKCSNWIVDPIISPFQPVLDRHVGQRNVHVDQVSSGMQLKTKLHLGNLFMTEAEVDVVATMLSAKIGRDFLQASGSQRLVSALLSFGAKTVAGVSAVTRAYDAPFVEASLAGGSRFYFAPAPDPVPALKATQETLSTAAPQATGQVSGFRPTRLLSATLQAGEQREIELTLGVPESALAGEALVCRLYQVTQGRVLGGYTLIIVVAN